MTTQGPRVRIGLVALWTLPALAGTGAGEVSLANHAQVVSRVQITCMVKGPRIQPYTDEAEVPPGGRNTLTIPMRAFQIMVTIWYRSEKGWVEFRSIPVAIPASRTLTYTLTGTMTHLHLD
jgi:hypothetical protein